MKSREADVRHLDVRAFAKSAGHSAGAWPLDGFDRLRDLLLPVPSTDSMAGSVEWSVTGEERPVRAGPSELWLHLQARSRLPMTCQRCLQRCEHDLQLERHFQFVPDEATASALDGEVEHEVLVIARELDLHELLEDELLLDLPLVPRHDVCPQPLPASAEAPAADEHPFAALAALRRPVG